MAKKRRIFLKLVISLLVIVLILSATFAVLITRTPRQLKLAKTKISGEDTIESLGFADVKLWTVLKFAKSLSKQPPMASLAPDAYSQADATTADGKFDSSSLTLTSTSPQYKYLLALKAYFPLATASLTLSEREFAYVMDTALKQFYDSGLAELAADYIQVVEILRRLETSVVQLSFFRQEGKLYAKAVLKFNISSYVKDINKKIPIYNIASSVCCTIVEEVSVSSVDGTISLVDFVSVAVNDQKPDVSQKALDALFKLTAADGEEPMTAKQVSDYVFRLVSQIAKDIGGIGTSDGGVFTCGEDGLDLSAHTLTFQTYTV